MVRRVPDLRGPLISAFVQRHDASLPVYASKLPEVQEDFDDNVSTFEEAPHAVDFYLSPIELDARMCLAVDPDVSERLTWEAWVVWMQAPEAMMAMGAAEPGDSSLFGLACVAYDLRQEVGFVPDLSSTYFPECILQRTWESEFPI